jgi:hypothetical protein
MVMGLSRHNGIRVKATHAVVAAFVFLVAGQGLGNSTAEQLNTPAQPVSTLYFGMHIHRAATTTSWPTIQFGSWRLWDADVAWAQLEPRRGEWHFDLLDKYVALAERHHVGILLTLGLTPQWASARPNEASAYQLGNAAEPEDLKDWRDYVQAVATRYEGKINEYEIWNEPYDRKSYSGDVGTMVTMTRQAAEIIKHVDEKNTVISAASSGSYGLSWFRQYISAGAGDCVDGIGYHLYVFPDPPEKMLALISSVREVMAERGLANKPLWNTESGWAKPKLFPNDSEAAAYVSRSYILNWAAGVGRFYWYAWDNHNWVTLELTDRRTQLPTAAATGYAKTEAWLVGAVMKSCVSRSDGTWIAELTRGKSRSWIVWNPSGSAEFRIPSTWRVRSATSLNGTDYKIPGTSVAVGFSPLLLHY